MNTIERFNGVQAFLQTVEAGSFSQAARQLNLSVSSVGKAVARLEQRLNTRLFHRSTRRMALTDEGRSFHEGCLRAMEQLESAESLLMERRSVPSGRLRIALPVLYGRDRVLPILLPLAERHPQLQIEAAFSNRAIDFSEDAYDLAVRIGRLEAGASLAAKRIGTQRLAVCASPAYLARAGEPSSPADLKHHACLPLMRAAGLEPWQFAGSGKAAMLVEAPGRIRLGHLEAVVQAARMGQGLAQVPAWLIERDVAEGALRIVLTEHETAGLPIHVVWPATRSMTARLRLVIDALAPSPGAKPD